MVLIIVLTYFVFFLIILIQGRVVQIRPRNIPPTALFITSYVCEILPWSSRCSAHRSTPPRWDTAVHRTLPLRTACHPVGRHWLRHAESWWERRLSRYPSLGHTWTGQTNESKTMKIYLMNLPTSSLLMFNVMRMQSVKDNPLFKALRQCWTVPSCQNDS